MLDMLLDQQTQEEPLLLKANQFFRKRTRKQKTALISYIKHRKDHHRHLSLLLYRGEGRNGKKKVVMMASLDK